ncbi:hypothetical protein [Amycolatopsis sp. DG1A-15b]|uniref:hypothetical protein n=1 Tax=Amycolatopsis sp. DG1A-15b TaxID=3052846 RepID=UPI00255BC840|nr:hypothetical protein [Amycolatopsis sp. DG1A-15b]WIX89562.1 hypothetical protein QRY02_03680 [Amycolatopsis sp. DG1A-15b]
MVSKTRVFLFMLVMLAAMIGLIVLLVSLGVAAFWVKTIPVAVLLFAGIFAQSMGLFQKKAKKTE